MIKTLTKRALNREVVLYLIFGVIAVALNIALYYVFIEIIKLPVWLGNVLDTLICILFQYITNRLWVFQSKNSVKGHDRVRPDTAVGMAQSLPALVGVAARGRDEPISCDDDPHSVDRKSVV